MGLIARLLIVALLAVAACDGPPLVEAQTSGGGMARCFTDGTTMGGKCTQADPLRSLVVLGTGIFGDGSDGACVFDGVNPVVGTTAPQTGAFYNVPAPLDAYEIYVQSRDIFCSTITISNLVFLDTNEFRVFASTSITMSGNSLLGPISETGFSGNVGGAGGAVASAGLLPTAGGTGGTGNTGAGSSGVNASAPATPNMTGNAGNGGAGAASAGGGGTSASAFSAAQGDLRALPSCLTGRTPTGATVGSTLSPGGGGGGGDNGTHHGGGGGAGGGYLVAASPRITTNSTSKLIAYGGDGGAGATGGGATGGGGGGHGGVACVVIGGGTQPTINVAGGAGGAGGSGGASGTAGHAGVILGPSGAAWVVGVQ